MLKKLSDIYLLFGIAMMLLAYFLPNELMYTYAYFGLGMIVLSVIAEAASKKKTPSTTNTGSNQKKLSSKHSVARNEAIVK